MSTYTGDVTPGSPAEFTASSLISIGKLAVDEKMSNNCYLLVDRSTSAKLLIDPAAAAEAIIAAYGEEFTGIVVTHRHWDHHRALAALVEKSPGVPVYAGAADAAEITEQTGIEVTHPLNHGETIPVGDQELEVIGLVGHTPGSIALLHRDPAGHPHLFTGDSLFPGGVGNTFGDADAFAQLINDAESKVFDVLPDDTHFYPGHGKDGTLGAERPHLSEWRARGW
ncbi:MAG: MBL fold metallo-hydrolase [Propionibacteriaceae bacterium]